MQIISRTLPSWENNKSFLRCQRSMRRSTGPWERMISLFGLTACRRSAYLGPQLKSSRVRCLSGADFSYNIENPCCPCLTPSYAPSCSGAICRPHSSPFESSPIFDALQLAAACIETYTSPSHGPLPRRQAPTWPSRSRRVRPPGTHCESIGRAQPARHAPSMAGTRVVEPVLQRLAHQGLVCAVGPAEQHQVRKEIRSEGGCVNRD